MADPTNIRILGSTSSATAVALDSDRVQPGHYLAVMGVSLANTSGESVTAAFSLVTGAESDQLLAKATVADADAAGSTVVWYLGEGQKLRCSVTGSAKSGPVSFIIFARHFYLEEEESVPLTDVPAIAH